MNRKTSSFCRQNSLAAILDRLHLTVKLGPAANQLEPDQQK